MTFHVVEASTEAPHRWIALQGQSDPFKADDALVQDLLDDHTGEGDAFVELRVAMVDALIRSGEPGPALEGRAKVNLCARLGKVKAVTDADAPAAGPEGQE